MRSTRAAVMLTLALAVIVAGCASSSRSARTVAGPQLTLSGTIKDQSSVRVRGSGLKPQIIQLVQCTSDTFTDASGTCDLTRPSLVRVRVNHDGSFDVPFPLRAFIGIGKRSEIDCVASKCVLVALDANGRSLASAKIGWTDEAPSPAPRLKVVGLAFGKMSSTATVHGTGYPAHADVTVTQCPNAASSTELAAVAADDCLYDSAVTVTADADGAFEARMTVFSRFQRSNGALVNCARQADTCVVAAPWPTSTRYRMSQVGLRRTS